MQVAKERVILQRIFVLSVL